MQERTSTTSRKMLIVVLALAFPLALSISAQAKSKSKGASQDSVKAGKSVFDKNCELCHYPDQTKSKIGPGLKGLFKLKELPVSHKPVTDANVREQIEKGNPNGKPMPMPGFGGKLSKDDIDNVLAYLKTL